VNTKTDKQDLDDGQGTGNRMRWTGNRMRWTGDRMRWTGDRMRWTWDRILDGMISGDQVGKESDISSVYCDETRQGKVNRAYKGCVDEGVQVQRMSTLGIVNE
jgi:hypothetical protein